jgi:hypothetical protein
MLKPTVAAELTPSMSAAADTVQAALRAPEEGRGRVLFILEFSSYGSSLAEAT